MKRWLLLLAVLMVPAGLNAQVFTGEGYGPVAAPPPPGRYRLRDAYPPYPGTYPAGPQTSPDTAEVGRPYYYPYTYPYGYPGGPYGSPGIYSDGDTVYVPGR